MVKMIFLPVGNSTKSQNASAQCHSSDPAPFKYTSQSLSVHVYFCPKATSGDMTYIGRHSQLFVNNSLAKKFQPGLHSSYREQQGNMLPAGATAVEKFKIIGENYFQ